MVELLAKIFIKDTKDLTTQDTRQRYGVLCGIAGIIFNVLLAGLKFVAGLLSGSIAIMADAAKAGYRWLRLDTLPGLKTALKLYRRMGFYEIAPYYDCLVPGTVFMEIWLDAQQTAEAV